MIVIISCISFVLEFLINYIFSDSRLLGLIILSTMVLVEPFFKKRRNMFFFYCFIMGFFYDFLYSGTYFLNAGLFLFIGFIVYVINSITPNNFFISIIELLFLICFYRFLCFLFFAFNGIIDFDFSLLFKSIYYSILINFIYGIILYFTLYFLSKLFNIRRIN